VYSDAISYFHGQLEEYISDEAQPRRFSLSGEIEEIHRDQFISVEDLSCTTHTGQQKNLAAYLKAMHKEERCRTLIMPI
jgi:hypothetical protein